MKAGVISSVLIWSRSLPARARLMSSPASWRVTVSASSLRNRTRPSKRTASGSIAALAFRILQGLVLHGPERLATLPGEGRGVLIFRLARGAVGPDALLH